MKKLNSNHLKLIAITAMTIDHVADLILVNSNPLDDISVLSNNDNILNVFQDGVLVK